MDACKLPAFIVVASMIGFGALVSSADMGIAVALIGTVFIWGLPGQVALVEFYLLGVPLLSLVLAVSMVNMRFLPMSLSLVPLFRGSVMGWRLRYLWTFLLSVNTWVGLARKIPELSADERGPYYAGFSIACMIGGIVGSTTGFIMADRLPFYVTVTLVYMNPVYFAFVFATSRSRAAGLALVAGALIGPPMYLLTPEWSLPFCGLIAGTAGFYADKWLKRRAA